MVNISIDYLFLAGFVLFALGLFIGFIWGDGHGYSECRRNIIEHERKEREQKAWADFFSQMGGHHE